MVVHGESIHCQVERIAVPTVQRIRFLNIVKFRSIGGSNQLETISSTDPNVTRSNVSDEARDNLVSTVEDIVFSPRCQPLAVCDVPASYTNSSESNVSNIIDDFDDSVRGRCGRFPFVINSETTLVNEAYTAEGSTKDRSAVHAYNVGCPIWHAVVNVETIIDGSVAW